MTARQSVPWLIRTIGFTLIGIAAAIVLVSLAQEILIHLHGLNPENRRIDRFSVDNEMSFGAWYSSLLLALAALALLYHGATDSTLRRGARLRWLVLAAVFIVLSADESVALHEILKRLQPILQTSGPFYFAWVVPALIVVPLGLLAYIPFIGEFSPRLRNLVLLSAAVFLGGSLGMEMVAADWVSRGNGGPDESLMFQVFSHIEETMEMSGVILFLMALLQHIRETQGGISIHFEDRETSYRPPER